MCAFIGVENLAANALLELYDNQKEDAAVKIGFKELADYGVSVVEKYNQESGADAVLMFDQEQLRRLATSHSDLFDIEEEDQKYLCLKSDVNVRKIKEQFRWTLSYNMLRALNQVSIMEMI